MLPDAFGEQAFPERRVYLDRFVRGAAARATPRRSQFRTGGSNDGRATAERGLAEGHIRCLPRKWARIAAARLNASVLDLGTKLILSVPIL